jgi:hypothetical protein
VLPRRTLSPKEAAGNRPIEHIFSKQRLLLLQPPSCSQFIMHAPWRCGNVQAT